MHRLFFCQVLSSRHKSDSFQKFKTWISSHKVKKTFVSWAKCHSLCLAARIIESRLAKQKSSVRCHMTSLTICTHKQLIRQSESLNALQNLHWKVLFCTLSDYAHRKISRPSVTWWCASCGCRFSRLFLLQSVYGVLKEAEHRSTFYIPYWKLPLARALVPRQRKFNQDLAVINECLDGLIKLAKETRSEGDEEALQSRNYEQVMTWQYVTFSFNVFYRSWTMFCLISSENK